MFRWYPTDAEEDTRHGHAGRGDGDDTGAAQSLPARPGAERGIPSSDFTRSCRSRSPRLSWRDSPHYSYTVLLRIRCSDEPSAGGPAPRTLNVLHEQAPGPPGSARRSRVAPSDCAANCHEQCGLNSPSSRNDVPGRSRLFPEMSFSSSLPASTQTVDNRKIAVF